MSFARELLQSHSNTEIAVNKEPELLVTPWCKAEEAAEEAGQLLCRLNCDARHRCAVEVPGAWKRNARSAQPESAEADREICDTSPAF